VKQLEPTRWARSPGDYEQNNCQAPAAELLATLLIAACRSSEEEHPLDLMLALGNVGIYSYALQRQLAAYIGCADENRAYRTRRLTTQLERK
jgi:hypothetical protein